MIEVHAKPSTRDPKVTMLVIMGSTIEEVEREVLNQQRYYDHLQLTTPVRSNAGKWARIGRAWSDK